MADDKIIRNDSQEESPHSDKRDLEKIDTLHETESSHKPFKGDDSDGHVAWTAKSVLATISLCGIWVGAQIPLYFVGGCLSFIQADIDSAATSSWLPVSYTLAIAAVSPFCGYLADIFGQRNIMLFGTILVIVGCILMGNAHNFAAGCSALSILGAGAAICELNALAGIASIVPVKSRGFYLAICTAFLFPWTPYVMYSQLLSTRATWRWTLWICLIYNGLCGLGLLLTFFPEEASGKRVKPSIKSVLGKIDFIGGILSITGITLFLVALGSGGYTHNWSSAYVLCTLLIGAALMVGFVVWEWRFAPHPMVPGALFTQNTVIWKAYLVAFVAGMNLYSLLNFFPLTFQTLFSPDPVQVGLKGLGYGISVTAGATIVNGLLSVFKKHNRELLVVSAVIMTAFSGALAAVSPSTPRLAVALGTIAGFGVGGVYVPAATIALTASPDTLIATTVALSLSVRTLGGAIGYTIYYNVFATRLKTYLPQMVGEAAANAGLPTSQLVSFVTAFATAPASAASVQGVTPSILAAAGAAMQQAYAHALRWVWYVSIPFGVCSIVASLLIGDVGKYMTNRIAVRIK